MTKLLLSCDDYVYEHNGYYYAGNQEKYEFYQRYLRIFDQLRLVTRCIHEDIIRQDRVKLSDDRIEYIPLPIFHGPKQYIKVYFKIGHIINNIYDDCNIAILRIPSTIAIRIGRKIKQHIPYALEIVFDAYDAWKGIKHIIYKVLWWKIDKEMKDLCNNAVGISCVTEYYLQQHYHSDRSNVVLSNYSSLSLPKSFYYKARIYPKKKFIEIAHVANQITYKGRKGHVEILYLVQSLHKLGFNVCVKFAGADYNNGISKLQQLAIDLGIESYVDFVGYLNRVELDTFLINADLFVLPTQAEGLPRVIIEAMAKGLPCVTTNVSGNSELIQSQFLVDDFHNVNKMAQCVVELLRNKDLYEYTSQYNYNQSLKYESSLLQKRRDIFYEQISNYAK